MNPNAQFERELERWLQAAAPASAPAGLHAAIVDRARTMRQRHGWATSLPAGWFGRGRGIPLLAAAALVVVGGAVAAGSGLVRLPSLVPPEAAPTIPVVAESAAPAPTAALVPGTPSPSPSRTPGFSSTGSMSAANAETATLLADGRVLVVHACQAGAELYDPVTGTFSRTGSPATLRIGQSATILEDGRVLVAGGASCDDANGGVWATAELFDPVSGTFSPTGAMGTPRMRQVATRLPDGRVLITGGTTGPSPAASAVIVLASYHKVRLAATGADLLVSAELYDPATGTFSDTGSMRTARDRHTATLLQDGRVLVIGGSGEAYPGTAEAELYDASTGAFTPTGSMLSVRWGLSATRLGDGRVLVTGGNREDGRTFGTTEVYDPRTGTFAKAGSMIEKRTGHAVALLADGRVLVAGGGQNGSGFLVLSSAEVFDPGTGKFTPMGSIREPRADGIATLLADGRVLIAGGVGSTGEGLSSALLYQP